MGGKAVPSPDMFPAMLRRVCLGVSLLGALACGATRAEGLAHLRLTLRHLESDAPINGVLEVQSGPAGGAPHGRKHPHTELRIGIQAGAGLRIHLAAALLRQIDVEQAAHAADPDRPAPTAALLRATGPVQIERMVSAAPMLLRTLDGAHSP